MARLVWMLAGALVPGGERALAGSTENVKEAVVRDARKFIGAQMVYDDLTLLVVKQVE